ncbi:MAG: DUF2818 family protein [Pseudomonadota bacterium]
MINDGIVWIYWFVGFCLSTGILLLVKRRWILLAWILALVIFVLSGLLLESRYIEIKEKVFSFYIIVGLVFSILGLPGYVLRFLKKG